MGVCGDGEMDEPRCVLVLYFMISLNMQPCLARQSVFIVDSVCLSTLFIHSIPFPPPPPQSINSHDAHSFHSIRANPPEAQKQWLIYNTRLVELEFKIFNEIISIS